MPPALAIIVNVITIFMVLGLYYLVYTQYRKRDRPQDSPMDVWKDIASTEKESAWNGFLNEEKKYSSNEGISYKIWQCQNCNSPDHSIEIKINSEGKDFFIEESEDNYPEDSWKEAFGWITINTKCNSCGVVNNEWISYETM